MYMILRYVTGRRAEGILLAASSGRMRLVVRKLNDTLELRLIDGTWLTDRNEPVEIESLVSRGQPEDTVFHSLYPRTHSARN
jgi:hypothetical protein